MIDESPIENLAVQKPALFSYEYARKRLSESPLRALITEKSDVPTKSQKEA